MHADLDKPNDSYTQRMRDLPHEVQPPYDWQAFQKRAHYRLIIQREVLGWRPAAVAAALAFIVLGFAIWGSVRTGHRLETGLGDIPVPAPPDILAGADPHSGTRTLSEEIAAPNPGESPHGSANYADLEIWLASLPSEPPVVRVGTRTAVARLEDRIAQVDDLMNSVRIEGAPPDNLAVLQQERNRLVGSLARVRYAEEIDAAAP